MVAIAQGNMLDALEDENPAQVVSRPSLTLKQTTRDILKSKQIGGLTLSEIESMVRREIFICGDETEGIIAWTKNQVIWKRLDDGGGIDIIARNDQIEHHFQVEKL
jgi:hypothetical protein